MDRAGPAQSCGATELCAGHAQDVAQDPEEWDIAIDIDEMARPVDLDCVGHRRFFRDKT
jgi:hypothetical protein